MTHDQALQVVEIALRDREKLGKNSALSLMLDWAEDYERRIVWPVSKDPMDEAFASGQARAVQEVNAKLRELLALNYTVIEDTPPQAGA